MSKTKINSSIFFQILKLTLPVFFGYIAIGIPFGLMLTDAGYPWWLAPLMGLTMYTGTGQYFAVPMFVAGVPLSAFLLTQLMVSIRHIVYGLSLIDQFKNTGVRKPYLIFALTDETYALLTGTKVPEGVDPADFYSIISGFDQSYWVTGSIIGALAGTLIPKEFTNGVDFALTALFVVLMIEQLKALKDWVPTLIGAFATILCVALAKLSIIPGDNILLIALGIGLFCLILAKGNKMNEVDDTGSGEQSNKNGGEE